MLSICQHRSDRLAIYHLSLPLVRAPPRGCRECGSPAIFWSDSSRINLRAAWRERPAVNYMGAAAVKPSILWSISCAICVANPQVLLTWRGLLSPESPAASARSSPASLRLLPAHDAEQAGAPTEQCPYLTHSHTTRLSHSTRTAPSATHSAVTLRIHRTPGAWLFSAFPAVSC